MSSPEADLLKVAADAPLAEVKKAFRRQALTLHPDLNPDPASARHFRRLTEAYRILEAQARLREPAKPDSRPLNQRVAFLLADLRSLVKRWSADRWTRVVDGLPAQVWLASVLEVLARNWPGQTDSSPVAATRDGIVEALEAWAVRLNSAPFPESLPHAAAVSLTQAVRNAETRLTALERPARTR